MARERVRVILNPRAAQGRALARLNDVEEALKRTGVDYEIVLTQGPGHATALANAARADGVDVVAPMGGDGTLNEVAQAYLDDKGEPIPGPDLALIPSGTGGDFKRTLGLGGTLDDAIGRITHGARTPVDLGVLRFEPHPGQTRVRAFVNVTSFGIGGQVDAIVNGTPKWLGGKASFFLATVRAMASYKNASVKVKIDGEPFYEGPAFNVALANGRFFGGGMMIAPQADPGDGRLEVVCIGDLSKLEAAGLSSKIYKGEHLRAAGVKVGAGARIEAEPVHAWATVLMDVDGEQPGKLPLVATVARAALTFRV